jgi:predicted O-methyltransferase YrrM
VLDNVTKNKIQFSLASSFKNFTYQKEDVDLQGWAGNAPILTELVKSRKPKLIADVGVWKGQSTITLAKAAKENNNNAVVFAIDTWIGSPQHWYGHEQFDFLESLKLVHGFPSLYYTFLANVFDSNVDDVIIPMPSTSESAYHLLMLEEVKFDMIHIDAAHEYDPVKRDIEDYWKLLDDGGVMVCDDYSIGWPGVYQAINEFVEKNNIRFESYGPKGVLYKDLKLSQ